MALPDVRQMESIKSRDALLALATLAQQKSTSQIRRSRHTFSFIDLDAAEVSAAYAVMPVRFEYVLVELVLIGSDSEFKARAQSSLESFQVCEQVCDVNKI